eukprot:7144206-Alexandrium_andersonii.AAC.1
MALWELGDLWAGARRQATTTNDNPICGAWWLGFVLRCVRNWWGSAQLWVVRWVGCGARSTSHQTGIASVW